MADEKSTPISKAARLLDLVPYISTHQGISIKDLANEFRISTAELLDDLNTLWMCGLPGYTPLELIDLSFDSGYVSIRNAEILQKVRLLTKEELVAIAIGLDLLKSSISTEREDIKLAIDSLALKVKDLIGEITVVQPTVDSAHRASIIRAMKERRDLDITFHSIIRDEITRRKISPIELAEENGLETLFAYCFQAKAFRTFRLDNIKQVDICDSVSIETASAPNEEIFKASFEILARWRATLERFRLNTTQTSKQLGEVFEVHSFSKEWLVRNFISTLGSTRIIGPSDLREPVRDRVASTLTLYKNPAFHRD